MEPVAVDPLPVPGLPEPEPLPDNEFDPPSLPDFWLCVSRAFGKRRTPSGASGGGEFVPAVGRPTRNGLLRRRFLLASSFRPKNPPFFFFLLRSEGFADGRLGAETAATDGNGGDTEFVRGRTAGISSRPLPIEV